MRDLSFLHWIILRTIAFSLKGYNYLHMSFGTKCTRLEQRDLILYTTLIHISASSHIIESICNSGKATKETIAEDLPSRLADPFKKRGDVIFKLRVHQSNTCGCC